MAVSKISNKQASSHADCEPLDANVCDYTLRKVFSWLEVRELVCCAALVSQRWSAAAGCKEVFRRRMHRNVLETLFNPNQQQPSSNSSDSTDDTSSTDQQQQQQQDPTAAAIAAVAAVRMSPARLFAAVYDGNLLLNGSFLERLNTHKGQRGARVWEPTFNPRGTTWAHPFDFFPELSPLPEEACGATPGKPFSIGCLATVGGAWSEVTQVVDLPSALASSGLPAAAASWILTAGLTVEFAVLVAGGAAAGGEYQVVVSLITPEDAEAAVNNELPLHTIPKMTLPFGHPPPGCPGIEVVSAAQMAARGLTTGSENIAKAPLHPPPGIWTRFSCRFVLPSGTPVSHIAVALRGRATRSSRLGHYAVKFADARLKFLPADEC